MDVEWCGSKRVWMTGKIGIRRLVLRMTGTVGGRKLLMR